MMFFFKVLTLIINTQQGAAPESVMRDSFTSSKIAHQTIAYKLETKSEKFYMTI